MRGLYWIVMTLLLAVVVHISYVLFVPRAAMGDAMESMEKAAGGRNVFRVLEGAQAGILTSRPMKYMHYGGCVAEPGNGRVEVSTRSTGGYWSLSIYSPSGNVIYTLNDRHADMSDIVVVLRPATEEDGALATPRLSEGRLLVPLREKRVLVVFSAYESHPGMGRRISEIMSASRCRHFPAAAS